jgi:hypothetical protein
LEYNLFFQVARSLGVQPVFSGGKITWSNLQPVFSGGEITWSTTCFCFKWRDHLEYNLLFQVARSLGVQPGVAAAQLAHCRAHRPGPPSKPLPLQIIKVAQMYSFFPRKIRKENTGYPELRTRISMVPHADVMLDTDTGL